MSKEIKLITALCEALGFKVEINLDYKERKEEKEAAMVYNMGYPNQDRALKVKEGSTCGELDIDDGGMYTSMLRSPEISYKLVKLDDKTEKA